MVDGDSPKSKSKPARSETRGRQSSWLRFERIDLTWLALVDQKRRAIPGSWARAEVGVDRTSMACVSLRSLPLGVQFRHCFRALPDASEGSDMWQPTADLYETTI